MGHDAFRDLVWVMRCSSDSNLDCKIVDGPQLDCDAFRVCIRVMRHSRDLIWVVMYSIYINLDREAFRVLMWFVIRPGP